MRLVGFLASASAGADWLYSSELGPSFEAWCENGRALAGSATDKYRELNALAATGLHETGQALDLVKAELVALDAAGRPQSIDETAGVLAAMKAMELAFTPEAAELQRQLIELRTLQSAYQADCSDGEVLARSGDALLKQLTKAGRQERNLESEVEFQLKTPALLSRHSASSRASAAALVRSANATANGTANATAPVAALQAVRAHSDGIVTVGFPDSSGDTISTGWDHKCLDYNYNDMNVYMHDCHSGSNQKWFMMDNSGATDKGQGELRTARDSNCLDYNYNNGNVYMHSCHGGRNQQWYFDASGQLRSRQDDKCLDYNYNDGNVYMHDCHGQSNQLWAFAKMRKVDTSSPLKVLQGLLDKLEQRKAECAAHVAQQKALADQQAGAAQHLTAQTADALQRMKDTAAVLKEYKVYREALSASQEEGKQLFSKERILYAAEVEHLTGQVADPLAASASTAMKAIDVAHSLWVEWKDGTNAAFDTLVSYLDTRHAQLENQLANQEYLRPDKSPHLMYAKTGPPVGLHCPDEAEYADRRRKIEEAIAALTAATR